MIDDSLIYEVIDATNKGSINFLHESKIPILWFGDSAAYEMSERKIVSIALNPSDKEFPKGNAYLRFPKLVGEFSLVDYREAVNSYFEVAPYKRWFCFIESMLNPLNASFYRGKAKNTALHIDFIAPVATNPTYGKLSKEQKSALESEFGAYYKKVINALSPDIVLLSLAKEYVEKIVGDGKKIYSIEAKEGIEYKVYETSTLLDSGKNIKVIVGLNFRGNAFGGVSKERKAEIIEQMKKEGHL